VCSNDRYVASRLLQFTVVWRAVHVTRQTAAQSSYAGPRLDAEQQQNQCQASVAVVTLVANPRAHQLQSRHFDVQGSSDVIAAVPEFTAEWPRLVTHSQTFQHAASDRSQNAHRTCQASVLCRCACSTEQSAGRHCWRKSQTVYCRSKNT